MTAETKLGQKRASDRIARYSAAVQWKADGPYFELDGKPTPLPLLPHPLPRPCVTTDGEGYISRAGVAIVVPSPWVGAGRNRAAAQFWRSMGFVLRDATNCEGLICTDLREWVRMVDEPLGGKVFTPAAWLKSAARKYQKLYLANRYMAFDIETSAAAPNDPGASYDLGITCAALYARETGEDIWYGEYGKPMTPSEVSDFAQALCDYAADGYIMAGINLTGFDCRVVAESAQDEPTYRNMQDLALASVDPAFQLFCARGFMKGMDAIAKGLQLTAQKGELGGLEAIAAWSDGRHLEVLEYVEQDALVTLEIIEACEKRRGVSWEKDGRILSHNFSQGLLTVRECLALPLPDTTWMKKRGMEPWSRDKFAGWLNDEHEGVR